ncbi:heme exporter protein CcmD [Endothiovibrio diazotrophicus]
MSSMSQFLSQGGYAFYVWCSYGVCAVLMLGELIALRRGRKGTLERIRRLIRMRAEEASR